MIPKWRGRLARIRRGTGIPARERCLSAYRGRLARKRCLTVPTWHGLFPPIARGRRAAPPPCLSATLPLPSPPLPSSP
ncbi:MAG: hypothetical protein LBK99_16415, partial [Opitutaceae bacterium]|nr:hypothetical protein [Opitutaceae bacterium]